MNGVIANAVSGMTMSTARFEAAARKVTQSPEADLAHGLVEAKLASLDFEANIAVLKTADEMWKATLDILA